MPDNLVTIYALMDPLTYRIHYGGQTRSGTVGRLASHLDNYDGTPEKRAWIKSLVDRGLRPSVIPLERVPRNQSRERERYWIAKLSECGHSLYVNEFGRAITMQPWEWRGYADRWHRVKGELEALASVAPPPVAKHAKTLARQAAKALDRIANDMHSAFPDDSPVRRMFDVDGQ